MTDFPTITDEQTDVDAPLTSVLMKSVVDQPLAMFEGSAGAPRLALKAIERVTAGDVIRSQRTGLTVSQGTTDNQMGEFAFLQIGTVRVEFSGGISNKRIIRDRAGVSTTMATGPGATLVADISVLPGDNLRFVGDGTADANDIAIYVKTDGGNLWPNGGQAVEGNDVL